MEARVVRVPRGRTFTSTQLPMPSQENNAQKAVVLDAQKGQKNTEYNLILARAFAGNDHDEDRIREEFQRLMEDIRRTSVVFGLWAGTRAVRASLPASLFINAESRMLRALIKQIVRQAIHFVQSSFRPLDVMHTNSPALQIRFPSRLLTLEATRVRILKYSRTTARGATGAIRTHALLQKNDNDLAKLAHFQCRACPQADGEAVERWNTEHWRADSGEAQTFQVRVRL
ncbi:hypothetical protein C8R43DRAFT_1140583 [Mycena crocata]|nr:hypothetical protein C8R43DRAFT_1140583 [Mycena crocata]